ncbi:hypothetical protein AB0E01_00050 [Nocardia vinacea]|uniref:hypothetical protein n=1 Tax=Nocardia vinacea TaxID=96468 RepID=UPI0033D0F68C
MKSIDLITRKSLTRGGIASAVVGLSAILVLAAPAHADTNDIFTVKTKAGDGLLASAGLAEFYANGENLRLYDGQPDGHGPRAWVDFGDPVYYIIGPLDNKQGYNTWSTRDGSLAEGRTGTLHVCMMNGSTILQATCNSVSVHS